MREADLYPPLKQHFETLGYAVFAEVPAPHGGYVDLLAIQEPISIAVELKARFSREAVRQAGRNRRFVWESYVAVPLGARISVGRRAVLKRHGAGLLAVGEPGVRTELSARRTAPPVTIRQAFGAHLKGKLADLYASACGGVTVGERVSAFRVFVEKVKESLEELGGVANTDQLLAGTAPWNYFRNKRAALRWVLEHKFKKLDAGLWAVTTGAVREPKEYNFECRELVRTHLPGTYVCVRPPNAVPNPGDLATIREGRQARRIRIVSAERHAVRETHQRELRAGLAVFFPWRWPREIPLPRETLVLRLASDAPGLP